MDTKQVKKELLKAVRGKRSQTQLSRRMGFNFNQVYRWESDLTRIHWKEFVKACEVCRIDLKQVLKDSLSYEEPVEQSEKFVQHVMGTQKIASLAKASGLSRYILSDWCNGHSDPTLEGILLLLHHRDFLTLFLENFPGMESSLNVSLKVKSKKAARSYFYENPLAGAAWVCLDLTDYQKASKHIPGLIAKHLGISLSEEKKILEQMEQLDLVVFENGKYKKSELNFITHGDFEGEKKIRSYWVQKGLQIDQARTRMTDQEHFGFVVFAADKKKRKQILDAYRSFANTLYTICNTESSHEDEPTVLTMQIFGLKNK